MDAGLKVIQEDLGLGAKETNLYVTWTLQETFMGLAVVLGLYLLLVLKLLPMYMKNREPYKLKNIMLAYNALQVAYSTYLVIIYVRYIYRYGIITKRCPKTPEMPEIESYILPYFIAKHLDFMDTILFVLRKKDNQVTFLHLYHHTTMVTWTWLHLMYYPTDNFVIVGMLNSFVHILMYAYYGISSLGPQYQKYVWWKKHLTKVQLMESLRFIIFGFCTMVSSLTEVILILVWCQTLVFMRQLPPVLANDNIFRDFVLFSVQFILVVSHLHYQQKLTPCPVPNFFHNYCVLLICSFFALFVKFYISSYQKKKSPVNEKTNAEYTDHQRLLKAR